MAALPQGTAGTAGASGVRRGSAAARVVRWRTDFAAATGYFDTHPEAPFRHPFCSRNQELVAMPATSTLLMPPQMPASARAGGGSTRPPAALREGDARETCPDNEARRTALVRALNEALRAELTGAQRHRDQCAAARELELPVAADRFQRYASAESIHAARLARRIVDLGGAVEAPVRSLGGHGAGALRETPDLTQMIHASLSAAGVGIDLYCRLLTLAAGRDPATQRLAEDIMNDGLMHAEGLWELQPA